jgi:hypothetical protein
MATKIRNSIGTSVVINADGFSQAGGTTTERALSITAGDVAITGGGSNTINYPFSGTAIFGKTTEVEIDFGTKPIRTKRFTITDALAATTSKILITPSGNIGTNRGTDDWEWDTINFAAKGNSGNFTLSAYASGKVGGKRKIFYTIN